MKIDRLTPTAEVLRELGRRLAHLRKQHGFSQQRLAQAAGVGIATLRRIEDGRDGKLGSWVRLLQPLGLDASLEQLLPADFRSPRAEALHGARPRRRRAGGGAGPGFVWGDGKP